MVHKKADCDSRSHFCLVLILSIHLLSVRVYGCEGWVANIMLNGQQCDKTLWQDVLPHCTSLLSLTLPTYVGLRAW